LEQRHGDFPSNTLLVIGGRDELNPSDWNVYQKYSVKISLEPFTEKEATAYLYQRGVTNPIAIKSILSISNCLPAYLSLLGESDPANPDDIFDPNEKIVERFLKHIKNPIHRKLALEAALPRKLDKDIITCLVGKDEDADTLFEWLRNRPFVQKRGGHWAYHPMVREIMMRHQRELSQVDWEKIHQQLAKWYEQRANRLEVEDDKDKWFEDEDWRLQTIEKHYHQLCANYKKQIPELMQDVARMFYLRNFGNVIPFASTLIESEVFCNNDKNWGDLLNKYTAVAIVNKTQDEEVFKFIKQINDPDWIQNRLH